MIHPVLFNFHFLMTESLLYRRGLASQNPPTPPVLKQAHKGSLQGGNPKTVFWQLMIPVVALWPCGGRRLGECPPGDCEVSLGGTTTQATDPPTPNEVLNAVSLGCSRGGDERQTFIMQTRTQICSSSAPGLCYELGLEIESVAVFIAVP